MKDKIKTILIIAITAIISFGTSATAQLVTRAENITLDSDKTDKTNMADALDELYERTESYCPEGWTCTPPPKCIRATTLHQEICNQTNTSLYCSATGSMGNGNTITYGNATTTEGVLNTGDAFDCDVDGTGYNHRFYYVSDLYTGGVEGSETFDTNTAVLIYYSNTIINGTTISSNNTTTFAYNSSGKNYEGPLTAISQIPGKDLWTNLSINETRQIRSHTGTTNTSGGTITFGEYTNKAARLLTMQEIKRGCGLTTSTMEANGSLDINKCRFLLENTNYATSANLYGYWLETPRAVNGYNILIVNSSTRSITGDYADLSGNYGRGGGVRPAIEVAKSDMSY